MTNNTDEQIDKALDDVMGCQPHDETDKIIVLALKHLRENLDKEYEQLKAERDRYKSALEQILVSAEFHKQDGIADYVSRYAHDSNCRIIEQALKGGSDE